MSKSTQAINLSNWFGIDRILFGGQNPKKVLGEEKFKVYISKKGALLSNLFEIYTLMKYSPKDMTFKNSIELKEYAETVADKCLNRAKSIIVEPSSAKAIREEIDIFSSKQKISPESVANFIISKKLMEAALDLLLMESASKSGCKKCIDNWDGKILVKSHKSLRESLINIIK